MQDLYGAQARCMRMYAILPELPSWHEENEIYSVRFSYRVPIAGTGFAAVQHVQTTNSPISFLRKTDQASVGPKQTSPGTLPQQFIISNSWSGSMVFGGGGSWGVSPPAGQLSGPVSHGSGGPSHLADNPTPLYQQHLTMPMTQYLQHGGSHQQCTGTTQPLLAGGHPSGVTVSNFYLPQEDDDEVTVGAAHVLPPGGSPLSMPPAPLATATISAASSEALSSRGDDAQVHSALWGGSNQRQRTTLHGQHMAQLSHGAVSVGGRKAARRPTAPSAHCSSPQGDRPPSPVAGFQDHEVVHCMPHEATETLLLQSPRKRAATPRSKLALAKQRSAKRVHCSQPDRFAAALSDALEAAALRRMEGSSSCDGDAHLAPAVGRVQAQAPAPSAAATTAVHALLSMSKASIVPGPKPSGKQQFTLPPTQHRR